MRIHRSLLLRAGAAGASALAVAATLASCGIPTDTQARGIEPPPPYQDFYATPTAPSPDPTGPATVGTYPEVLCLTRDGALVEVTRHLDEQPTVAELAEHLVAAPSPEEKEQGLGSTVVPLLFEPPVVTDGLAVVEFGEGLESISQDATLTVVAQIVCTLDQHPDVTAVAFTNDGVTASVPKGDGITTDLPVTREDYVILLASTAAATPTTS